MTLLKVRFLQLGAILKACFAKSMCFICLMAATPDYESALVLIFRHLPVAPPLEMNEINVIQHFETLYYVSFKNYYQVSALTGKLLYFSREQIVYPQI